MKCLIIAAGRGTRLAGKGEMKPLVPLCGVPIIEHVILRSVLGGVTGFVIVTGFNSGPLESFLVELGRRHDIPITTVHNREWHKGNGISVLTGKSLLEENFVLVMSDHLFDPSTLRDLIGTHISDGEVILAVDRNIRDNPYVDMEDVTKVLEDVTEGMEGLTKGMEEGGRIREIGKHIDAFNAFDTGMFLCTPVLFEALEESLREHGNESLSGGMEILSNEGRARTFDIGGRYWIDIDSEDMFSLAETLLEREEP